MKQNTNTLADEQDETAGPEVKSFAVIMCSGHADMNVASEGGNHNIAVETFKNQTELSSIVNSLQQSFADVRVIKLIRGRELKFVEKRQLVLT